MKPIQTAAIMLAFSISGCAVIPESIERSPDPGHEEAAETGVGEVMYFYERTGRKFVDYMNAQEHQQTDSVRQELIYSGLSDGEVKITYREYVNDLARSAFYQEAQYPYDERGVTVSFKGAEIEFLQATPNNATYIVRKGFNNEDAPTDSESEEQESENEGLQRMPNN